MIASKDIGLVLRIFWQNPTEDQIVEMVMKVRREDFKFHVQTRVGLLVRLIYKQY